MISDLIKNQVWEKGAIIPGYDAGLWRSDDFGNSISFSAYGDRNSDYGWEIDHIIPVENGGSDMLSNRCFRHKLLLPSPYLVLTKSLRLDIQCQRAALLHESELARIDPDPRLLHRPMRYDIGLPSPVI